MINDVEVFPCERLTSTPQRAIGLIVLSSDEVGAEAFSSIVSRAGARVFVTRTVYEDSSSSDGKFVIKPSFPDVCATLPPPGRFGVLAFSCTNGTVAMGAKALLNELSSARPGLRYTSPAIAGIHALDFLKARRIAFLSPYLKNTHKLFYSFYADNDIAISADGTFNLSTDAEIGKIASASLFAAAKNLVANDKPDAIFISCTATPIVPHIDQLEQDIGIPVVSSSQAMAWDALRLANYNDPVAGFGRLLSAQNRVRAQPRF